MGRVEDTGAGRAARDQEAAFERDFDAHLTGETRNELTGEWDPPTAGRESAVDVASLLERPEQVTFTSLNDLSTYLAMEREAGAIAAGHATVPASPAQLAHARMSSDFPQSPRAALRVPPQAGTARGPRHSAMSDRSRDEGIIR